MCTRFWLQHEEGELCHTIARLLLLVAFAAGSAQRSGWYLHCSNMLFREVKVTVPGCILTQSAVHTVMSQCELRVSMMSTRMLGCSDGSGPRGPCAGGAVASLGSSKASNGVRLVCPAGVCIQYRQLLLGHPQACTRPCVTAASIRNCTAAAQPARS